MEVDCGLVVLTLAHNSAQKFVEILPAFSTWKAFETAEQIQYFLNVEAAHVHTHVRSEVKTVSSDEADLRIHIARCVDTFRFRS